MSNNKNTDDFENLGYVNYDIHKDCTQTGSVFLSPQQMRLTVLTVCAVFEHQISYTVTKKEDIEMIYAEIGCRPTDDTNIVKKFLHARFPRPQMVKEFIDAKKIEYKCSSVSQSGNSLPRSRK